MQLNDLPVDLLEEIFLHFVSRSQDHPSSPPSKSNFRSPESPLFLSKICKQWREISLRFGRLWTHLHVVNPKEVTIVEHLEEWMNRTGSIPLCLSLREGTAQYNHAPSAAVLWLFLNSLHRCRAFEMDVKTGLEYFGLERLEQASFTSLETVRVKCNDYRGNNSAILANLLLNTSSLRTIKWSGPMRPLDAVSPSWGNLRQLEIENLTLHDGIFDAFSHCQNLEYLKIQVSFSNNDDSKSVILPRLTQLSILLNSPHAATINQLFLPLLEELELVLTHVPLVWDPVLGLIRRSGMTLRKFVILTALHTNFLRMNHVEFVDILKMSEFQELRVLRVERPIVGDHIVTFLTLPSRGDPGVGDGNEARGYLIHLERIYMVFGDTPRKQISQSLRKLIDSRVGISHKPKPLKEYIQMHTNDRFSLSISSS